MTTSFRDPFDFDGITGLEYCDDVVVDLDIIPSGFPLCTIPSFAAATQVARTPEITPPDLVAPPICFCLTFDVTATINTGLVTFDIWKNELEECCDPTYMVSLHISLPFGLTGLTGPIGLTGLTGLTGPTGPTGCPACESQGYLNTTPKAVLWERPAADADERLDECWKAGDLVCVSGERNDKSYMGYTTVENDAFWTGNDWNIQLNDITWISDDPGSTTLLDAVICHGDCPPAGPSGPTGPTGPTGDKLAMMKLLGGYRGLFCVEAPEVIFFDTVLDVEVTGSASVVIDPLFIDACEANSISVISAVPDRPVAVGAEVDNDRLVISAADEKPVKVNCLIEGTRKGRLNVRFPEFTEEQMNKNNAFWQQALD